MGINLKKIKILIQKDIDVLMFTEALFIINKIWKQPVFIDGLMDKNIVVSVFVMKYYSAKKMKFCYL